MGLVKAQKRLEKAQEKEAKPKLGRFSMTQEEYRVVQDFRVGRTQVVQPVE